MARQTSHARLPRRGPQVRDLDLALPPGRMPLVRGGRPLKRWRYVGVFGPDLMLCVGDARIGPVRRRWWAAAFPDGRLLEGTGMFGSGGARIAGSRVEIENPQLRARLDVEEVEPVETASAHGAGYIWTAKQADVRVSGSLEVEGALRQVDLRGVVDDSAGYHARHTAWKWSAGVGRARDGRSVGWNLVTGVHDAPVGSERTVWVEGDPHEVPPVEFDRDLSRVGQLEFRPWATREDDANLLLLRSRYRQPFGEFSGELPGGLELAEGWGVMEDHDVHW